MNRNSICRNLDLKQGHAIFVIGYNNVQKYVYPTLFVATPIQSRDILIPLIRMAKNTTAWPKYIIMCLLSEEISAISFSGYH